MKVKKILMGLMVLGGLAAVPNIVNAAPSTKEAVQVKKYDSLKTAATDYAKALQDSGVDVSFYIYKGMPHAFILRTYEETFAALDEICKFLIE